LSRETDLAIQIGTWHWLTDLYAEMLAQIDRPILTRALALMHGKQRWSKLWALGILPEHAEWSAEDHSSPLVGYGSANGRIQPSAFQTSR
jgi:hypothetical protein